jgi:hypothetical protein
MSARIAVIDLQILDGVKLDQRGEGLCQSLEVVGSRSRPHDGERAGFVLV